MPTKTVEAGHKVVNPDNAASEAPANVDDTANGVYEPGMAPLASGSKGSNAGASHTLGSLRNTNKAALESIAKKRGVDLSGAKNNGERASLIWDDIQKKGDHEPLPETPEQAEAREKAEAAKAAAEAKADEVAQAVGAKPADETDNAASEAPANVDDGSMRIIILQKKASLASRGRQFIKGEPVPVSPELAEILLNTNLFVEG